MKPCDSHPGIRCAFGGVCRGKVYWEGKAEKPQPLDQVLECKWPKRATECARRDQIDRNHNPA